MKIAIVILNWNGKELLEKFLPSVIKNSEGAAIYVADNASTDASIDFLKSNFLNVTIIQNSENGGYAKGYNDALKLVDADVFCLLNSDVEVTKNWLEPVIKEFKEHGISCVKLEHPSMDKRLTIYYKLGGDGEKILKKLGNIK